ncbi:DotD/TraH family lipoprotein [Candidatus Comchoanobacter bicostacola]|uniref:DotD/TraH family lipoprotein n=1 Tax=Candidatus Comchoanobacter bicostacola TaxID=2919598 RepID=A0ABY5DJB7_9GAMM|nr:DotD/TraH family lipoprotein [Candidatus Comchoanobacter bicostacola]UTC24411.1 DotD/TraH family lipoprotein [Candidatus Comchoanobacter bicostacola]
MNKHVISFALLGLLAGCLGEPTDDYAPSKTVVQNLLPDAPKDTSDTQLALSEAARAASASLQKLAQLQSAAQAPVDESFRQDFSIELSGLASVEYTGPCEPLIEQIAQTANVKVVKIGNPTATAVIISIKADAIPLSEMIQSIAYQVSNHAKVSYNSKDKVIEIIYLN